MRIDPDGNVTIQTGDLIMADGKGIDFSADASPAAGMTAEILDDYEEGEFGGTGANAILAPFSSGSITCGTSGTCSYTKIGRAVTVTGHVDTSAVSSPVGATKVVLPFAIADLTQVAGRFAGSLALAGSDFPASTTMTFAFGIEGNSFAVIYFAQHGTAWSDTSAILGGQGVGFSFTYNAA